MIRFQCQCGRFLDVGDQFAGKQVRCPSCQQVARVPLATSPVAPTIPAAVPAAAPIAFEGTGLPPMTQRDLTHERHLRALAFWNILFGGLILVGGICGMAGFGFAASGGAGPMAAAMGVLLVVNLVLGGGMFAVGYCLWKYQGWARWTMIFLCALNVLRSLRGLGHSAGVFELLFWLAWAGAVLWALVSPSAATICSPGYRALVAQSPHERVAFWTSPFFWVPLVLLALGCGLMALVVGSIGFMR